jgi:hypothetical protein
MHRLQPTGLQVDRKAMLLAEVDPGLAVGIAERLQVAHGQRNRAVAADELDLRDVALAFQRFDES